MLFMLDLEKIRQSRLGDIDSEVERAESLLVFGLKLTQEAVHRNEKMFTTLAGGLLITVQTSE